MKVGFSFSLLDVALSFSMMASSSSSSSSSSSEPDVKSPSSSDSSMLIHSTLMSSNMTLTSSSSVVGWGSFLSSVLSSFVLFIWTMTGVVRKWQPVSSFSPLAFTFWIASGSLCFVDSSLHPTLWVLVVPESLQQWLVGVQGQGIMGNGNGSAFEVVQGETVVNVLGFAFGSVSKDSRHSMWWQEVLLLKNIRCWNIKIKTYPDLVSLALFSAPACCSCFSLLLHPRYLPMPVPSPNWFILLFFLGFVTYLSLFASLGVSGCCKMGLLYWARLFPIQCDCCSSILLLWANTCWLRSLISRRGPTSALLGACCASKDDFSWNSLPCSWQMVSGWGCLPIAAAVFSASVPREIYPLYKMSSITFCWKLNSVTIWAGTSPGRVGSWRLWRRPSGPWWNKLYTNI